MNMNHSLTSDQIIATVVSVSVCQAGYNSHELKTAVAVVAGGALGDPCYRLLQANDRVPVYSGTMECFQPAGWTRGELYYKIDFSSYTASGSYIIRTNGVASQPFTISENVWLEYTDEMVGYYRIQRCGVDTREALPETGFTNRPSPEALHGPCHTDDARVGSPTGPHADCTGGWHDAGDNNKYNSQFGWLAAAFVSTYYRHPGAAFDYDANGVPDLLDEARVAAEYLLKVQAASDHGGGIFDQVQNHTKSHAWIYPGSETDGVPGNEDDRVLEWREFKKYAPFPYDTAMKAAAGLAAVARAFAVLDAAFSDRCRRGAVNAYNWALDNTVNTGGAYCTDVQEYARLLAEVELYLLTGEASHSGFVDAYIDSHASISARGTNYWGVEPLALADYYDVAGPRQEKIVALLTEAVDQWIDGLAAPFGVSGEIISSKFGINEPNMSKAADAYRLYEITGNIQARDAALRAMEWTFGVNPFDMSFVVGIGSKYPRYPHSRLDADAETNPHSSIYLPGFMVCGPIAHDTLDAGSVCPWYVDRPLTEDGLAQWRYNEHSVSIQFACLDLVIARAFGTERGGNTPSV